MAVRYSTAPNQDGWAEAIVKSCKLAIKKAIGDNKLTSFEIDSCFLEIANVINQRPIGRVSTDPSEGTYLVLMTFCLDVHPLKYPKDYLERLETHENTLSLYREYWMIFRNTGKERSSQHWFREEESGMETEHYQKYGTRWLKLCKLQFNMATKSDYKIYRREQKYYTLNVCSRGK